MCGRFALGIPPYNLAEFLNIADLDIDELAPRYNIAPTTQVYGAVHDRDRSRNALRQFRWGLVPHWAKDPAIGARLINARGETLDEKPSFRDAFRHRRCIIPATGFYEWHKSGRVREPWYLYRRDGDPLLFAGLWERWEHSGEMLTSCTIVTTGANETVAPLHNRMPVILGREALHRWLDPDAPRDELQSLLVPAPADTLRRHPVDPAMNDPRHEGPGCIAPVPPPDSLFPDIGGEH